MKNIWTSITTKKATKQPVSASVQRTVIPMSNKCDAIEIESENMSKSW